MIKALWFRWLMVIGIIMAILIGYLSWLVHGVNRRATNAAIATDLRLAAAMLIEDAFERDVDLPVGLHWYEPAMLRYNQPSYLGLDGSDDTESDFIRTNVSSVGLGERKPILFVRPDVFGGTRTQAVFWRRAGSAGLLHTQLHVYWIEEDMFEVVRNGLPVEVSTLEVARTRSGVDP
ncbi:MAG: hypothetical protein AAGI53_01865 [Planctomycetota bacterium]